MGTRDISEKRPYGSRFRTLHRVPLWLSDVLPDEARRNWPIVLPSQRRVRLTRHGGSTCVRRRIRRPFRSHVATTALPFLVIASLAAHVRRLRRLQWEGFPH